jgi:hypothetical protein
MPPSAHSPLSDEDPRWRIFFRVELHALAQAVGRRGYNRMQGTLAKLASGSGRLQVRQEDDGLFYFRHRFEFAAPSLEDAEQQARDIYAVAFEAGHLPRPGPGEVIVVHLGPRITPD